MFRTFTFIFILAASAGAAEVRLTLDSAADYALTHNPTLAAARLRIEEARGRLQQSGRLSNPELEFDFTRNTMGREGSLGVALMQRFPLTARLRHEKAVSRAELAAAEAEVRDGERKLARRGPRGGGEAARARGAARAAGAGSSPTAASSRRFCSSAWRSARLRRWMPRRLNSRRGRSRSRTSSSRRRKWRWSANCARCLAWRATRA